MQKLMTWAQEIDRRHRWLLQWAVVGLMAVIFALGSVNHGPATILTCSSWAERKIYILMFAGLFIGAMAACLLLRRKMDWPRFLFVAALMMVALLIRIAVFNQVTADYSNFLSNWVKTFRLEGTKALAKEVGDYNLPYQYILLLISKVNLNPMYLIKFVSVMFDFALAILAMCTVERFISKDHGHVVLAVLLLLPTYWFNGAFWAQCDTIYCFFVLACVYAMLVDRPVLSVTLLTIAFSFKIQTIFFFPIVLLALWGKKYKLRHALVFVGVYLISLAPALLCGRSLVSALSIYIRQTGQYNDRLTFNAANIYQFMPFGELGSQPVYMAILKYIPGVSPTQVNEWYTLETIKYLLSALVPYAGILVLGAVYYLFNRRKWVNMNQIWRLSLAFTLLIPMVLPKMHDRYFALAELFAVLYAIRYPKRWYIPVMVTFSSFMSYLPFLARERPLDLRIAATIMVAATGLVLYDVMHELRTAKAADSAELCLDKQ